MKPIKFDLPLNGQRASNLEQLADNLTPQIIEHFRSGKLLKWLRARDLETQAQQIEALNSANIQDEVPLFIKLCEVFERQVDEDDALDMIEDYKSTLAESVEVLSTIEVEEIEEIVETEDVISEQTMANNVPEVQTVIETKVEVKTTPVKPKEFVINQKLLAVLAREKKPFYVMNDIPSKKLKNAINAYGGVGVEFETPLILLDATLLGSAKEGFLLTTESISIYTTWDDDKGRKQSFSLKDIYSVSIASDRICINDNRTCRFNTHDDDGWKAFKAFFKDYLSL